MANIVADRVKERISGTPGTSSTLTLSAAPTGFRRFSSVMSIGDTCYAVIENGAAWEIGIYTYSAVNTLTRTTVLKSSNSDSLINVGANAFVFISYIADKATYKDGSGRIVSGAAGIIFSDNTVQTTAASSPEWGNIDGDITDQTDLSNALGLKAPLASPTFTGIPAGPTASGGTNSTQLATTAFVASAVGSIDLSPYLTISSAASTYLTQSSATTLLAAKADLVGGLVPSSQLPSYVDDVVEAANLAAFPSTGETGKIYVAIDTGYTYRWSGSVYVRINEVDLSSYLTAATAASTYLPLAGGTLTGDLTLSGSLITTRTWTSGISSVWSGIITPGSASGSSTWINLISGTTWGGTVVPTLSYTPYSGTLSFRDIWGGGTLEIGSGSGRTGMSSVFGVGLRIAPLGTTVSMRIGDHGEWGRNTQFENWHVNNSIIFTGTGFSGAFGWDASHIFALKNSTNAQTLRVYETSTSATSFGALQIKANAGAAYQIGSAVGSAGGSNRDISLGHWDSAGTFTNRFYITSSGNTGISPGTVGYLRDIFQVNTTSTSTSFGSGSIAPQGITITNSTNTANRPIGLQFSGYEGWGFGGIYGTMTSSGGNTYGRISIVLRSASGGSYTEVCRWDENSCFTLTPWVSTSGSITGFAYTDAANTGQTASTEATSVNFNLSSTKQFATGALTAQRAFRIQAPTYSFVGASTITTASTLSISGPPAAGTNATITNAYALNVESGNSYFNGGVRAVGSSVYAPAYGFGSDNSGFFRSTSSRIFLGLNANAHYDFNSGNLCINSGSYGVAGGSVDSNSADVLWVRDAAGIWATRNGTNAQMLRIYNTHTSSTSYEAGVLDWQTEANVLCFGTVKGSGGGSARQLKIVTDGTAALTISTAQAITASSTLTAVGTITSQGAISNDRYAATPLIRVRRAGGTSTSPTQVTTAQTIGIIGSYGYHDGGAFHSNTGASIQFVSTEAYTSTAQGTEIRFATAETGATSASTRLTIEDNGVFSFQKLVGQETEVTGTPSGTTQTLTLNDGNHQTLALTSSTGNVTVTLTVPDRSSSGTIIVKQHGTTPRDITWAVSSGTIKWMGTEPTWNSDATNDVRIVSWRWNGSVMYLMSTDVAA